MSPIIVANSRASAVRQNAFTLVEIAMAIAVVALAFVSLIALIPAGYTTFRRSIDATVCAQIAQRIFGDAEQTDFDTLIDEWNLPGSPVPEGFTFRAPKVNSPGLRYFDDQGMEVVPLNPTRFSTAEKARIIYYVNTRIMPRMPLPKTSGGAATGNGSLHPETLAQITIQVAHNPGQFTLPISPAAADAIASPGRNLFDSTKQAMRGVEVLTYSGDVGRNL